MCLPEKRIPGGILTSLPCLKGGGFRQRRKTEGLILAFPWGGKGVFEADGLKITTVLIDIPKVHQEIPHIPLPTNKKSAHFRKNLPVFPA